MYHIAANGSDLCYFRGMKCLSLLLSGFVFAAVLRAAEIPYDTLRERIVEDLASGGVWQLPDSKETKDPVATANAECAQLLASLGPDGTWPDVDYANRHRTLWAPGTHLTRLLTLATAYGVPTSPRFRDPVLHEALLRGLRKWHAAHPRSDNWWYNHIYAPQRLGEILLLLQNGGGALPPDLLKPMLERWRAEGADPTRKGFNTTGANLMNISAHWCYRGILTRDAETLRIGAEGLFRPLCLTEREGLQHDFSYHQHGPQLYLGNYGYDWLFLQAAWLCRFRGSPLAPPPEAANLAVRYALEAYFPATRGAWYLFNAIGRQQASEPTRGSATKSLPILRWLERLAPDHAEAFRAAAARLQKDPKAPPPEPHARVFWRSDYALHVRPAFTFDVRAASRRTNRCERGNGENLLGYWLSEGSTGFTRDGGEYADIAPLWDWHHVPGTTVVDHADDAAIPRRGDWGIRGKETFVGGVSDGESLAFAYRREAKELPAHLAWFALGDAVACLGAGLRSEGSAPLVTTVDQCWARGPVEPAEALTQGRLETPAALTHAGFRYTFPEKGVLHVSKEHRKNNWKRVSSTQNAPVEGDVLTLWLDHGAAPKNAAYAYIVSPADRPAPTLRILSNTLALQAVEDASGRLAALFHTPGACRNLTVSAPCALLRTPRGLFVADPSQSLATLTVTENGAAHTLTLPTGPLAGSPVRVR